MVPVFYSITLGLHLMDFPADLQIIRENKSKKAIMNTLFKCFDIHSCICFHAYMLSIAGNLKALVQSILAAQPNPSSMQKILTNAVNYWPLDDQHPAPCPVSFLIITPASCLEVPCFDYTATHLHLSVQCLESPLLPCPSEKIHSSRLRLSHFYCVMKVGQRSYLSSTHMACWINKCSLLSAKHLALDI